MKCFEVWNPDYNGVAYVHALTRSKARYWVLCQAQEVYPGWTFANLNVRHIPALDGKPITAQTLAGIASEDDRYQRTCRCDICKAARE